MKCLIIATLIFSFGAHAIEEKKDFERYYDYDTGGAQGGYSGLTSGGSTTGGTTTGGTTTGRTSTGVGIDNGLTSGVVTSGGISDSSPTELNSLDVKPAAGGKCQVRGITSGAWAGSPCQRLYGKNPINVGSVTGTTSGGVTGKSLTGGITDVGLTSGSVTSGTTSIGTTTGRTSIGTTTGRTTIGIQDGGKDQLEYAKE